MTTEVQKLKFKLRFLETMIPVMNAEDLAAYTGCALSFLKRELTSDQLSKVDELVNKFSPKEFK